jgi:type II secretory pathway component GspD/PulD (secretin)
MAPGLLQAIQSDIPPLSSAQVASTAKVTPANPKSYRINFNNVSIIEYIRFISKITGSNFVFDEGDLQFNVTILSEEPATLENIFSALIQVLRSNNLNLLEQDGNYLITKSPSVAQMSDIVTNPSEESSKTALSTRVFRVSNTRAESIANIIRGMISQRAQIAIFAETNQIIITDITTNIDKISSLIEILDTPSNQLEIESYTAKHIPVLTLVTLAQQILTPFTEGNPLFLVPQHETNAIFVISTPYLTRKSLLILEDLDSPMRASELGLPSLTDNIFLYTVLHRQKEEILAAIKSLTSQFQAMRNPPTQLISMLHTAHYVPESNTLVFIGDALSFVKIQEILSSIDTMSAGDQILIYKLQTDNAQQIQNSLAELMTNLTKTSTPDLSLLQAIRSLTYSPDSNAFIFNGDKESLAHLQQIIATFDQAGIASRFSFYLFQAKVADEKQIQTALSQLEKSLSSAPIPDTAILAALNGVKYIPETRTFVFFGSQETLKRIQEILNEFDTPDNGIGSQQANRFFIYTPKNIPADELIQGIREMAEHLRSSGLSDPTLLRTLQTAIATDHAILFTGDASALASLQSILANMDLSSKTTASQQAYTIYQLKSTTPEDAISYLNKIAQHLGKTTVYGEMAKVIGEIETPDSHSLLLTGNSAAVDQVYKILEQYDGSLTGQALNSVFIYIPKYLDPQTLQSALLSLSTDLPAIDPPLLKAIQTARYVAANRSLAFSGTTTALETLKNVISELDVPSAAQVGMQKIGESTFFIYKIQYADVAQLETSLKSIAVDLTKGGTTDRDVAQAIYSMKWVKETNSILFTGTEAALIKIQEQILPQFDVPALSGPPSSEQSIMTYATYHPQARPGDELIQLLRDFENTLRLGGVLQTNLITTINNLKWMEPTCTIVLTGDPDSIKKVEQLLRQFDVPTQQSILINQEKEFDETNFLVYKLQYHQGEDIRVALRKIATELHDSHPGQKLPVANAIEGMQWFPGTNSLLVCGPRDVLSAVKQLLEELDVPLRQVFIEVLILKTQVGNIQNLGLSWGSRGQYRNKVAGQIGNFQTQPPSSIPDPLLTSKFGSIGTSTTPSATSFATPSGFDLGVIGDIIFHKGQSFFSLGSFIDALQTDSDTTIITNPKLVAQDSNTATVFYGQNVPFTGSLVQNTASAITTTTSLEYRNVGNNISITPRLGSNTLITLDISIALSSTVGTLAGSTPSNQVQGIVTDQQNIATRVHVPSGLFVCLTGQLDNEKRHDRTQIPCLGGIPRIGGLFANTGRTNQRTNVVIFIRPEIIDRFDDYQKLSSRQEELFMEASSLPNVQETIQEGIGWVKMPEDE